MNSSRRRRCAPWVATAILAISIGGSGCGDAPRGHTGEGEASPTPDLDFPSCRTVDPDFEVGLLDADFLEMVAEPLVSDSAVLLHRRATAYSNQANDLEVFRVDPRSGATEQLTANDTDDILLDANDGALLLVTTNAVDYTTSIIYRTPAGEEVLMSGLHYRPFYGFEDPTHLVNREAATFLESGEVYLYAEGELRVVSDGLDGNTLPSLDGTTVVWTASDGGDREIFMATPTGRERLTDDDGQDWMPVLSGGRLFWLRDSQAMTMALADRRVETVDSGPCHRFAVDGDQAVFVCREVESGDPSSEWAFYGQRLVYFDGRSASTVVSDRDDILAVALDAGRIAWVEYPAETEYAYWPTIGEVAFVGSPGAPDAEPRVVAPIGSGCWYCDAYWPLPRLLMEGDLLAWSYGVDPSLEPGDRWEEGEPIFGLGIGYALIGQSLVCGP